MTITRNVGSLPINTGRLPVDAGSLPMNIGRLPVDAGSLPMTIGTLPVDAGRLPVGAGRLPIGFVSGLPMLYMDPHCSYRDCHPWIVNDVIAYAY